MASEKRIPRFWALVISILVSGPIFHLLLIEESFVSKYGSVTIESSSSGLQGIKNGNSGLPTEGRQVQLDEGSVDSEKGRLPKDPTNENRWSKDKGSYYINLVENAKSWEEEEEFNTWEEEQRRRRSHVDKACAARSDLGIGKKRGRSGVLHHQRMFTYNKKHNLLYCLQPKVASTTWLRHFVSLENVTQQLILKKADRDTQKKLLSPKDADIVKLAAESVSFSMVRHPFEKLVSAYLNKVVPKTKLSLPLQKLISKHGDLSFPSFVRWLTSEDHKDVCFKNGQNEDCNFNPHWLPLQARCFYCIVPYKVIAKFETFSDDLRHISLLANITLTEGLQENPTEILKKKIANGKNLTQVKSLGKGGASSSKRGTEGTTQRALLYFKQLSRREVDALYRLYKDDFVMFNYSPKPYLDAATPD